MNIGSKTLIEKHPSLSDLRYKAKRIPLTALGSAQPVCCRARPCLIYPSCLFLASSRLVDAQIRCFCYQGFSKAAKGCKEYLCSSDVISSALVWNFLLTRFKYKPTTLPKVRVQNVHF